MTVYKITEVVGTSGTSVSDAVRAAIERAGETLDDLAWFEVKEIRGAIAEGKVDEYQVKVDIGFALHAAEKKTGEGAGNRDRTGTTRQARSTAAQVAAKSGERRRTDLAKGFEKQPSRKKTRRS